MFGAIVLLLLCATGGSLLLAQCLCSVRTPAPVDVALGSARSRSPRRRPPHVHLVRLQT